MKDNWGMIGRGVGTIDRVVDLLKYGSAAGKTQATSALRALTADDTNRQVGGQGILELQEFRASLRCSGVIWVVGGSSWGLIHLFICWL